MRRKIDIITVCDKELAYHIGKAIEEAGFGYEVTIVEETEDRVKLQVCKFIG